ncbi:MAG: hypothetical protein ACJAUG_003517 [Halioglobus sp.]|jgi:hypothetical protein
MPVSELEKNPDNRMRPTRTENKRPSGASFKLDDNSVARKRAYLEEKPTWEQA